ncbi:hypothetical protein FB451DRAFT_1038671, partial [Mycena latifolia]
QKKPSSAMRFAQEAIRLDPNNLDAVMFTARYMPALPDAVRLLQRAEVTGRREFLQRTFGDHIFERPVANFFWGVLKTRPYVRLVKNLTFMAYEAKEYELVLKLGVQVLRACPEDAFGQHVSLGSLLVLLERYSEALSFCQKWFHPDNPPDLGGTAFDPPHHEMISATEADQMVADRELDNGAQGAVVHTAALAAFKLWGDCPESRQYLELAARINPLILLKILGRIDIPKRPSAQMRRPNGPEDAQSYLWRMQEQWMKPDVWDWANSNANVQLCVRRICSGCEAAESAVAAFKRCAGCHLVSYCSSACQRADWPNHKQLCRQHKEKKDGIRAFGEKIPKRKKKTQPEAE